MNLYMPIKWVIIYFLLGINVLLYIFCRSLFNLMCISVSSKTWNSFLLCSESCLCLVSFPKILLPVVCVWIVCTSLEAAHIFAQQHVVELAFSRDRNTSNLVPWLRIPFPGMASCVTGRPMVWQASCTPWKTKRYSPFSRVESVATVTPAKAVSVPGQSTQAPAILESCTEHIGGQVKMASNYPIEPGRSLTWLFSSPPTQSSHSLMAG